jgi:hypothetical protein
MAQKTFVSFSLDTEADKDILRWLKGLTSKKKSESIRAAIRGHIGRSGVTIGDVYQAVKDLDRKLQAGIVVRQGEDLAGGDDWDEPPDVAAALDKLAEL